MGFADYITIMEKERDKIKSLISDISHQTKTPTANILMYTELLSERDDVPEDTRKVTEQIEPQAEKLNFLIQSFIKVSRLESGIVAVHPSPNDLSDLMADTTAECFPKAEAKRILLTVCESPALSALFDLKWTAEALYNNVDNAVKYPKRGSLHHAAGTERGAAAARAGYGTVTSRFSAPFVHNRISVFRSRMNYRKSNTYKIKIY